MFTTLVKLSDSIERKPQTVTFEDFLILAEGSCNFKLEIQKNSFIKLLNPTLKKNISSVTLYWF